MSVELWDVETGNIIGSYDDMTAAVRAAFGLGQANPGMSASDLAVRRDGCPHETFHPDVCPSGPSCDYCGGTDHTDEAHEE